MRSDRFLTMVRSPIKFRWFLFSFIPSAFFSGVRIRSIDHDRCKVSVPYKWFTRNPFRSTYFASLAMAAEMSTGALLMLHRSNSSNPVSMLIVSIEAIYRKKAVSTTIFTCSDGQPIREIIESLAPGESALIEAYTSGRNASNEPVAEFFVTWSVKKSNTKS